VASQLAQFTAHDGRDHVWELDKNTVYVGGCVAVILEAPANLAAQYQLRIGDSEPVRLVDSLGLTIRWNDRTVVLLSHDLRHAEHVQSTQQAEELVRVPPIFRKPGAVTLRLVLNDELVGTLSLEVIETPAAGQATNELLFPIFNREAPEKDPEDALLWIQLVAKPMFGVTPPLSPEQLEQLRAELPVVMRHPDWAEIAEMLVGRVEARDHYHGLIESGEGQPLGIKQSVGAMPPLPDIVTRCLEAKVQSPFAQAIQRDIRSIATDLRVLDAQRRGEDPIDILRSANVER
jgi:hypothetical protein